MAAGVMDARVEDYLNDKLQTLADFDSLDALLANLKSQQQLLKQQLADAERELATTEDASQSLANSTHKHTAIFQSKQADIDRRLLIVTQSDTSQDAAVRFEASMDKLRRFDIANAYVETLQRVDHLNTQAIKDVESAPYPALAAYTELSSLHQSLLSLQDAAEGAAPHLVDHVGAQVQASRAAIKGIFGAELDRVLSKVLWPKPGTLLPESLQPDFDDAFTKLLELQRPELDALTKSSSPAVLYPLEIMVKPMAQRFQYHFSGDRPTNRIDKPEYFFSHVIDLLNAHVDFVNVHIQPVLLRYVAGSSLAMDPVYLDATSALITAMLPMLRSKLLLAVPKITGQPKLLSHLIHELMGFDGILRDEWQYQPGTSSSSAQPWRGLTHEILTHNNLYEHWLKVEMDFALARYEAIIADKTTAELDYDSVAPTASKPTKAAIRVHDLLAAITDHYRPLVSFGQKLRFLIDIQISIFDRFHERLHSGLEAYLSLTSSIGRTVQSASAADLAATQGIAGLERLCRIYSSAEYLERAMRDWSDDVFFLDLWTELQHRAQSGDKVAGAMSVQEVAQRTSSTLDPDDDSSDPANTGALFDETASAYGRLKLRSESVVCDNLITAAREPLRSYGRTAASWTLADADDASFSVSPDLAQLLRTLSTSFEFLHRALAPLPLRKISRALARNVESYVWDRVMLANRFSLPGAKQLSVDVNAIEAEFGQDGTDMKRCREALVLLCLEEKPAATPDSNSSPIGLWDVDKRLFASNESARNVLEMLNLDNITESEARKVLRCRTEVAG